MTDAGDDEDGPRLRLAAPEHQPEWLNGNAARTIAARETARVMALFRSKPFASMFKTTTDDAVPSVEILRAAKTRLQSAYLEKVERIDEQLAALRAQLEDASVSETRKSVIPSHIESTKKMLDEEDAQVRATSADLDEVAEAVERLPANVEAAAREVRKRREVHERRLANDPHYGIECVEEAMAFIQERAMIASRERSDSRGGRGGRTFGSRGGRERLKPKHIHRIGALCCDGSAPVTIVREPTAFTHSDSRFDILRTQPSPRSPDQLMELCALAFMATRSIKTGLAVQAAFPNSQDDGACTFFKPDGYASYFLIHTESNVYAHELYSCATNQDVAPTFAEEFIRDSCACDAYQRIRDCNVDERRLLCASMQVALSALKRCLPPPSAFNLADDATTVPNDDDDDDATSDSSDRKRARRSVSVSQQMSTA